MLLALLLLGLTPIGVHAAFDGALSVRLRAGPLRVTVYPPRAKKERARPKRERKKKSGGKRKAAEKKERGTAEGAAEKPGEPGEKKPFPQPNREQLAYSLRVLPPLVKRALGRTRRRILIAPLRVLAVFGGEDPADAAELYGKAQAAVSAVYPALKRLVRIRDDAVNLYTDYDSETIFFRGEIGIRIRLGDVALIAVSAAAGLLRWLIGYRRRAGKPHKRTGGTVEKQQAGAA